MRKICYNINTQELSPSEIKILYMSESKSSKKKTSSKASKTSTSTGKKKTSSSKKTSSQKKGIKTEKKEDGFKKFHIPVKVIDAPQAKNNKQLYSVPETVASSEKSSNNIKSPQKNTSSSEGTSSGSEKKSKTFSASTETGKKPDFHQKTPSKDTSSQKDDSGKGRSFSFNMYRKLALVFIVLTIVLVGGVLYFSFPGLKITLFPQAEKVSANLSAEVYDSDKNKTSSLSQSAVAGTIEEVTVRKEKTFQSTGARTTGKEIEGEVRIINNYTQDQPLVETTRLLSPEEKLYRIKEEVVVPAGGSKKVEIYTEEPSPDMAIGPTEFTIPGLWAGLQDDVYAESEEEFKYRVKVQRYVQQSDIDKALEKIRSDLKQKVNDNFGDGYKDNDKAVFNIQQDTVTTTVKAEAGEEKDEFTVAIEAKVNVVAFKNNKMADLASKKMTTSIPNNRKLARFNKEKMSYSIEEFDARAGVATISSSLEGEVIIREDSNIINKDKVVNLNKEQLRSYLRDMKGIKDHKLEFSPSFLQRVPNLKDRIEINIKTQ